VPSETEQALIDYLVNDLLYDKGLSTLGSSDSLLDSGTIESLGILQLVSFCEANFEVEIPDNDVIPHNFETVEALASMVERLRERLLK
jgi:acyl carrier protein